MKRRENTMKIIIVYESKYGNTKKAAEAIGEGLSEKGHEIRVLRVKDTNLNEIQQYDVVVIGPPTYAGTHATSIRKFINNISTLNLEGKSVIALILIRREEKVLFSGKQFSRWKNS